MHHSPRWALALVAWSFCFSVHGAESLGAYIAALENELQMSRQSPLSRVLAGDRPPSLDAPRLLQQSFAIIHTASPAQRQRLADAIIAFVPHYIIQAEVKPIPAPAEYLGFTELHVIYSEILDRAGNVQHAGWAGGNKELLEASLRRLCSAPTTLDFYRRVLDGEIASRRYPESAVPQARALSARFLQRIAWYVSPANLSTCRDPSRARVAP